MTVSKLRMLFLAATLVVMPAAAGAQNSAFRTALVGEWDGPLTLDGGIHNLSFIFRLADTTLTGYVNDGGENFGNMESLSLSGDTVRFGVQGLEFTGVVSRNTMNVDLIVFNGSHRKMTATKLEEKPKPERDDISRE